MKNKFDNNPKIIDKKELKLKCNFDLYEDEQILYLDEYKKFINSEPELEDAQMMRTLKHEELFNAIQDNDLTNKNELYTKDYMNKNIRSLPASKVKKVPDNKEFIDKKDSNMNSLENEIKSQFSSEFMTEELCKIHQFQPSSHYTVVAPKHLRSLAEICKTYGKGRESVKKWYSEGAPIAFDGFSYFSEYHALQNWLVERGRKLKNS